MLRFMNDLHETVRTKANDVVKTSKLSTSPSALTYKLYINIPARYVTVVVSSVILGATSVHNCQASDELNGVERASVTLNIFGPWRTQFVADRTGTNSLSEVEVTRGASGL
jgi:hypothetical protein